MERRELLAGGGLALAIGGFGVYFAFADDGTPTPSGISQRNVHVEELVVEADDAYERRLAVEDGELTVFETESAARDRLRDREAVTSFVESVDFETSVLAAVETSVGAPDDLELAKVTRSDETVVLHVDEINKSGSDALDYQSLLIALRSDPPLDPDDIDVEFSEATSDSWF